MLRLSRRCLPLALLVVAGLCVAPAAGQAEIALKDSVPHITVMGRAETEVVPNLAIISLAVATERPKASDAAAENARAARALIDEIKAEGIAAKDIVTTSITLIPVYDQLRDAAGRVLKKTLRGYQARNSLAIRVRAVDQAGALASRLIDKGANEVQDISFDYEHKDEIYDRLRNEAMLDALRQAKAYLPAVKLNLGRVLEITPSEFIGAPNIRYKRGRSTFAAPAASAPSIPIEPGTLTLDTEVQVIWELVP